MSNMTGNTNRPAKSGISPESSQGRDPITSSPSRGTDPTDYSPLAHRLPGYRPVHALNASQPSTHSQVPAVGSNVLTYQASEDDDDSIHTYDVGEYFSTETSLPQFTRYIEIRSPGYVDFAAILQTNLDRAASGSLNTDRFNIYSQSPFQYAVPLTTGKEQPEYPKRLKFDDLLSARKGLEILQQSGYDAFFITNVQYAQAKYDVLDANKRHEGQLSIWVELTGSFDQTDIEAENDMRSMFEHFTSCFGSVLDARVDVWAGCRVRFRIEFHALTACKRTLKAMHCMMERGQFNLPIWSVTRRFAWRIVSVSEYAPWSADATAHPGSVMPPPVMQPLLGAGPNFPLGAARFPGNSFGAPYGISPYLSHHAAATSADSQNRVHMARIINGLDVRTTIMLRNIPNRMDWLGLKDILDTYCWGEYDFLYLRIDFKTCSNVGYAFINFTNASALLSVIEHIENRVWPGYHSSKHAEISYATIQGKEALIQKFRNSSVMREAPYCRPRIFLSREECEMRLDLIAIGSEMPFPTPDNLPKLQRSIDNARNVGLYPPHRNGGQDHRNRQSTFDRGTPRDLMETGADTPLGFNGYPAMRRPGLHYPGNLSTDYAHVQAGSHARGATIGPGPIQRPSAFSGQSMRTGTTSFNFFQ